MIMQDQRILQVGNSLAVTLPSKFVKTTNIKAGMSVTVVADDIAGIVKITPVLKKKLKDQVVSPDFKRWLDTFVSENEFLIKELAKR